MPMLKPLPPADDPNLLQCECDKDYALLEMCYERLGIIGEEKKCLEKDTRLWEGLKENTFGKFWNRLLKVH